MLRSLRCQLMYTLAPAVYASPQERHKRGCWTAGVCNSTHKRTSAADGLLV
jgi:hypothetical protein